MNAPQSSLAGCDSGDDWWGEIARLAADPARRTPAGQAPGGAPPAGELLALLAAWGRMDARARRALLVTAEALGAS